MMSYPDLRRDTASNHPVSPSLKPQRLLSWCRPTPEFNTKASNSVASSSPPSPPAIMIRSHILDAKSLIRPSMSLFPVALHANEPRSHPHPAPSSSRLLARPHRPRTPPRRDHK